VLDNAPTYLTFLAEALGLQGLSMDNARRMSEFIARHDHHLVAISLGATYFGALTYVGNGPNLLIKAIAEHAKIETPSLFSHAFKFATFAGANFRARFHLVFPKVKPRDCTNLRRPEQ
jgi:Na+/H+ antiporter NhaD/arsenite permease-like protein